MSSLSRHPRLSRRGLLGASLLPLLGGCRRPAPQAPGVWAGLCRESEAPENFALESLHEIRSPLYGRVRVAGPPPESWPPDVAFPVLDAQIAAAGAVFLADAPLGGRLLQFTPLPRPGSVGDTWHLSFPVPVRARITRDLWGSR